MSLFSTIGNAFKSGLQTFENLGTRAKDLFSNLGHHAKSLNGHIKTGAETIKQMTNGIEFLKPVNEIAGNVSNFSDSFGEGIQQVDDGINVGSQLYEQTRNSLERTHKKAKSHYQEAYDIIKKHRGRK